MSVNDKNYHAESMPPCTKLVWELFSLEVDTDKNVYCDKNSENTSRESSIWNDTLDLYHFKRNTNSTLIYSDPSMNSKMLATYILS